ncbi:MAG TPA: excinuclease ABC subunit UvrA [Bacteroidales bacterium]|nr:excinuclease ABC subunit UvrA [Bacteroidales bacterium]
MPDQDLIRINHASENNLRSVSLDIPKNKLVVVTGVSGSGKSSLVFDVLYREAENLFLGSFSSHALQFMGKRRRPAVEHITGLSPAVSVSQKTIQSSPRSTVGTMTEIYDYLRLLYARLGKSDTPGQNLVIDRSLFSFNTPKGACPVCKGYGVEDRLDPELLVADASKSIRDRALVITAPNGYIIYSQVTMDVLNQVCEAEGFSVDIPWKDLTPAQKDIILYGSNKIEIPFGKHTLESRMRWSGITAKPREMGYYKGILPIMEGILKRERNKNILRFVRTCSCSACHGTRLNHSALSVKIHDRNIASLAALQLNELRDTLLRMEFTGREREVSGPIIGQIVQRINTLIELGLGYLSCDRDSASLSGGESQRLRLANQVNTGLQHVLYLFDEPSVGLHPRDTDRLLRILESLRDKGNSVIVVEHEEAFLRRADWLIDIGPGAGIYGGEVLHNIATEQMSLIPPEGIAKSRTLSFFTGKERIEIPSVRREGRGEIVITGASAHNLKNIDVAFKLEALNVVTGVSGAGKSSLAEDVLGNYLKKILKGEPAPADHFISITGAENVKKIIDIDSTPIGRTPRSNPATYTGMFDAIRDLFASQPLAKERGYYKSRFSFNTAGGRCEECQGAGYQEVGMHFMGNVEILCEKCEGKRFDMETLEVMYRGKSIFDVLDMYISEAREFFSDHASIRRFLDAMYDLGLGYLKIGQRSTTLSGGEAQRVKLATELALPHTSKCLYILDEPTTGLHQADISVLLAALNALVEQGNTVIVVEHHTGLIAAADHVIDLGPESGIEGGYVVASGTPEEVATCESSYTGKVLKEYLGKCEAPAAGGKGNREQLRSSVSLKGVTTNNLKSINVSVPHNQITVITGVSGSGKSSLAFDTIYAEGRNRYLESFSTYARTHIGMQDKPDFEEVSGLTPTLAVDQRMNGVNPRSTAGTATGIYDLYRLLFSRIGKTQSPAGPVLSSLFSFNHQHGACPVCDGLGEITVGDPDLLVTDPEKSLLDGAMDGTKTGKFYGDPYGQYTSTLKAVGNARGVDFSLPWKDLPLPARDLAMNGAGEEIFDVTWEYRRGNREGTYHFNGRWIGLVALVNEEYTRKHADHRGEEMMAVMKQEVCPACYGARLCNEALSYTIEGKNIAQVSALTVAQSIRFFSDPGFLAGDEESKAISSQLVHEILQRFGFLDNIGLSYLPLDRNTATLSGGEAQRIRLGGQLGSGLTGITYVLDEPTLGLHPADVGRLMQMIVRLKEQHNTVVIVEHDRDVIRSADRVIDMGPGAGKSGGTILAEGTPEEIIRNPSSVTGVFLGARLFPSDHKHNILSPGIEIRGANVHNLRDIDVSIPSGGIILITGVSGSGKSSLVFDVIRESWKKSKPCGCTAITGLDRFDNLVAVTPRSVFSGSTGTPATYSGIFDKIRDLFAKTEEARSRGLARNQFSFLNKEGRCPYCQGSGKIRVAMDFLSDVWTICEECHGQRYIPDVLACRYNGKNIAEVLGMPVAEAAVFFRDQKAIAGSLAMLEEVGLGYLQLGQSLDTLSGGESQRLMLATELIRPVKGKNLYLFEEPSTGLHFLDIRHLNDLFAKLAGQGHTLLIIEHDPEIIQYADHLLDLGPGGGDRGGQIVAEGTLQEVMKNAGSVTGKALSDYFLISD